MKKISMIFLVAILLPMRTVVVAQMLAESPIPAGGNPVGIWQATDQALQIYVAPEILAALGALSFGGTLSGSLELKPAGTYTADYIVSADVKLSHILLALDTTLVEEEKSVGTYEILGSSLVLISGQEPAVRDTLGFTVSGDSLHLVQSVPLGGFESLFLALFPASPAPLAVLTLGLNGGSDPIEITADFSGNGIVDFADFVLFARKFGTKSGEEQFEVRFDLNANDEVDFPDFISFARQYGRSVQATE
jgi:hypothetical protein